MTALKGANIFTVVPPAQPRLPKLKALDTMCQLPRTRAPTLYYLKEQHVASRQGCPEKFTILSQLTQVSTRPCAKTYTAKECGTGATSYMDILPVEVLQMIFQHVFLCTYNMDARDRWLRDIRGASGRFAEVVDGMTFRGNFIFWYWNPKTARLHVK